jgi:hypothetical protein
MDELDYDSRATLIEENEIYRWIGIKMFSKNHLIEFENALFERV